MATIPVSPPPPTVERISGHSLWKYDEGYIFTSTYAADGLMGGYIVGSALHLVETTKNVVSFWFIVPCNGEQQSLTFHLFYEGGSWVDERAYLC